MRRANDPRFDAWRGMAKWCLERGPERKEASVVSISRGFHGRYTGHALTMKCLSCSVPVASLQTREMYDEYGAEYIKDHPFVSAMI